MTGRAMLWRRILRERREQALSVRTRLAEARMRRRLAWVYGVRPSASRGAGGASGISISSV